MFLGSGGWVTCSYVECPNPTAIADLLDSGTESPYVRRDQFDARAKAAEAQVVELRERALPEGAKLVPCDFCGLTVVVRRKPQPVTPPQPGVDGATFWVQVDALIPGSVGEGKRDGEIVIYTGMKELDDRVVPLDYEPPEPVTPPTVKIRAADVGSDPIKTPSVTIRFASCVRGGETGNGDRIIAVRLHVHPHGQPHGYYEWFAPDDLIEVLVEPTDGPETQR